MGRLFIFSVFIHLNTSDKGLRILCRLLTKMTSVNSHFGEIFLSAPPGCNETLPLAAIPAPKPKAVLATQARLPPLGTESPYLLPGPASRHLSWVSCELQTKVRLVFKGESRNGFSILNTGGYLDATRFISQPTSPSSYIFQLALKSAVHLTHRFWPSLHQVVKLHQRSLAPACPRGRTSPAYFGL